MGSSLQKVCERTNLKGKPRINPGKTYIDDRENVHESEIDDQNENGSVYVHNSFLVQFLVPINQSE